MRRSFYHYLMTLRGHDPHDAIENFARAASLDPMFPKQTEDYHELADYLELNVDYLPSMDLFDRVYEQYLENAK